MTFSAMTCRFCLMGVWGLNIFPMQIIYAVAPLLYAALIHANSRRNGGYRGRSISNPDVV